MFIALLLPPQPSYDNTLSLLLGHGGIIKSQHAQEILLYPTIKPIDYLGFVHE